MDVAEAIKQRRSIRAFRPDGVPQEVLKDIMDIALRAPSGSNAQPWEFAIVGGSKLEEIKRAFHEELGKQPNFDFPLPQQYPEPYSTRRRAVLAKLYESLGIDREDREERRKLQLRGMGFWGAPNAVYIYIDRSLCIQDDTVLIWPILDCGLVAENIMLLATSHGLGTVPLAQVIAYPDVLRRILGIPGTKLMVLGIAIGYPDWDNPLSQFRSDRLQLDEVANWYGFD